MTNKLHYLVIGDEGSPLYGHGKKGIKQVKAEELNAAGANIKIISETAFLKMLAGQVQEVSQDAALAGCERLWQMAIAPGPADAPLARFALKYIRRHHPDIALAETDRPVDPGAEIPAGFLTSSGSSRCSARAASRSATWRWSWPAGSSPAGRRRPRSWSAWRRARTPTCAGSWRKPCWPRMRPKHRRYRIDPATLTPAAVYSFCESADESTRALGMELIRRSPRLQLPEELFRLTESPDRKVRGFVIRTLWSLYRDRGITADWKPSLPPQPTLDLGREEGRGRGERPGQRPAGAARAACPPARRHCGRSSAASSSRSRRPARRRARRQGVGERLKPLPARKAKLALVEVMRDLALEDAAFARGVLPLVEEFMISRGASERAACLVAVTRIRHTHPELRLDRQGVAP